MSVMIASVLMLVMIAFVLRILSARPKVTTELDVCPECGGKTEHTCGMGACCDWCPKCGVTRC